MYRFLRQMAELHDNKLPYGLHGQSWTVQSFTTYFLQRFSSAVNMAVAQKIRSQICSCPRPHRRGRGASKRFRSLCARGTLSGPRHGPS
jgi:hypothetical protein